MSAGKKPKWDQFIEFDVKDASKMICIAVFDDDGRPESHELVSRYSTVLIKFLHVAQIGAKEYKISEFINTGPDAIEKQYDILYEANSVGKVTIKSTWTPYFV